MYWVSEEETWIPLYAFLMYLLYKRYGFKGLWFVVLIVVGTVAATDQSSVKLFKNVFMRYRPCHNLEIGHLVHLVNEHCGGLYGFVSSHAANSFGVATSIGLFLHQKKELWLLWLWAALVSYSRIYLGVHYPTDIIGGAILGIVVAYVLFTFTFPWVPEKDRSFE
jgi:undecaprenyl-diphosphatase